MRPSPLAKDAGPWPVDALNVKGLTEFAGRSLQVFYVAASPPTITWSNRTAAVSGGLFGSGLPVPRAVLLGPVRFPIANDGTATVPRRMVDRWNQWGVNYVAMMVTEAAAPDAYLGDYVHNEFAADRRVANTASLPESAFANDFLGYIEVEVVECLHGRPGRAGQAGAVVLFPTDLLRH